MNQTQRIDVLRSLYYIFINNTDYGTTYDTSYHPTTDSSVTMRSKHPIPTTLVVAALVLVPTAVFLWNIAYLHSCEYFGTVSSNEVSAAPVRITISDSGEDSSFVRLQHINISAHNDSAGIEEIGVGPQTPLLQSSYPLIKSCIQSAPRTPSRNQSMKRSTP